ncbi:MAG TPA: Ig-like domain repeat protein [Marmoricola sp.]|nr:Ig-like domain repeat protein [Marmoricola sp.]
MKVTTFGKAGLSFATALSVSLALGISSAHATPTPPTANDMDSNLTAATIGSQTLVGVGSDTIQDVEYGISQHLGNYDASHLKLASWTATGTTQLTYRGGGTPASHPNGSGAGFTALKESIGAVGLGTDGVKIGDVDYSRASGFQGNEQQDQTGVVTEIPFAIDAMSFAAPAGSPFLATNGGQGLTLANLASIYAGSLQYADSQKTVDGTPTGAPNPHYGDLLTAAQKATATDTTLPIQAFVPKSGSGSRQFFLKQLHAVNSAVAYGSDKGDSDFSSAGAPTEGATPAPYVGAEMPNGSNVQEHDATVLVGGAVDPTKVAAIAPFSAAKFIGYHNQLIADPSGKVAGTDYVLVPFDSMVPGTATAELPYTVNGTVYAPNSSYVTNAVEGTASLTREVFNIIPTAAVNYPTANTQFANLNKMFVGANSLFCQSSSVIQQYGFLTDAQCGNTNRTANIGGSDTTSSGYSPSTATATFTPAVAGKSTSVTVTVGATGNPGGSVTVNLGGVTRTATVAPSATSVTFSVPTPNAGTFSLPTGSAANTGAIFVPSLAGDAASAITGGSVTVSKATPVVRASAPRVSHRVIAKVKVTVSATGLVPTGKVTVVLQKGAKKITRTVTLSKGSATAQFGKLAKGKYTVYVSYSGSSNVSAKGKTKLATLTVF